jgi:hypothetical protein
LEASRRAAAAADAELRAALVWCRVCLRGADTVQEAVRAEAVRAKADLELGAARLQGALQELETLRVMAPRYIRNGCSSYPTQGDSTRVVKELREAQQAGVQKLDEAAAEARRQRAKIVTSPFIYIIDALIVSLGLHC